MVFEVDTMLLGVTEAIYDTGSNNSVLDGLFGFGLQNAAVVYIRLKVRDDVDEVLQRRFSNEVSMNLIQRAHLVNSSNEVLRLGGFLA